jgi:Glycosyl transferase family group 2
MVILLACILAILPIRHLLRDAVSRGINSSAMRAAVFAVWVVPLLELVLLVAGHLYYKFLFRRAPGKFRLLIIQITTTGREQQRVNDIIASMRGYRLPMDHQIWVVTEPGQENSYPQADRLVVVPAEFTARSERKARAMEFARRIRGSEGLDQAWVKILYNDDDVLPTRDYALTAFEADYDVCEGITAPRTEYGVRPFSHMVTSHVDDVRAKQCLIYCSVFQGLLGKPIHIHGEGLTVTGEAERIVTWDYPVFASEDLAFGQNAAKLGLRWGWFHQCVELTSPWTLRDFFIQRRRWLWGNIHAISHRDVLPRTCAAAVAAKYTVDSSIFLFSVAGIVMRFTGLLPPTSLIYGVSKLALLAWLAVFFGVGWMGASGSVDGRNVDSRLLAALMAVLFSPLSCLLTMAGEIYPLFAGNPRTFEVIRKTRIQ